MTRDEVIDLIKDAGYGVLATTEGDCPHARPMMPYLTEEGDLLFATFAKKRVVSQIQKNPNIEMCYIDRKMNFARISGKAHLCDEPEKKKLIWDNVPMLRQYFSSLEDPGFTLLEVTTGKVEAATPQQMQPDILSLK